MTLTADAKAAADILLKGALADRIEVAKRMAADSEAASQVVGALVSLMSMSDETLINWVSEALENCSEPSPSEAARLLQLASDPHEDIAFWALKLLGRLGESVQSSQDVIAGQLVEGRPLQVRENAAWALGKIGGLTAEARKRLEVAAKSEQPRLSRLAKEALES